LTIAPARAISCFPGKKHAIARAFYVKYDQNYGLRATKNQQEIKLLVDSITGTRICQPIKRQKINATNRTAAVVVGVAFYKFRSKTHSAAYMKKAVAISHLIFKLERYGFSS
jgi:hypothetical protein